MSDLIDRQNAIDVLEILADKMSDEGQTVMAQAVAVLKDLQSEEPERTVKVEDKYHDYLPYSRFMESELKGNCGFCGETVWLGEKYCHECGTKLDWSGNE